MHGKSKMGRFNLDAIKRRMAGLRDGGDIVTDEELKNFT